MFAEALAPLDPFPTTAALAALATALLTPHILSRREVPSWPSSAMHGALVACCAGLSLGVQNVAYAAFSFALTVPLLFIFK
jgi:hypothetical protein